MSEKGKLDEAEFEAWWQAHGQYCRAGGGDYEKTFAYRAAEYFAARATTPSPSTGIKPDPEHLIALALSGSLPEQQAGKVLRDAFAPSTASEVAELPRKLDPDEGSHDYVHGYNEAIDACRAALAAKTAENLEHIEAAPPPDRRQGERRS